MMNKEFLWAISHPVYKHIGRLLLQNRDDGKTTIIIGNLRTDLKKDCHFCKDFVKQTDRIFFKETVSLNNVYV